MTEAPTNLAPEPFPVIDIYDKNPNKYLDKARAIVLEYYNLNHIELGEELHISEVYVVWFSKTLQNWKALVATEVADDGLYFEVTHNGDKNETYLDAYKKVSNKVLYDIGSSGNHVGLEKKFPPHRPGAVDSNGDALPNSGISDQRNI